MGLGALEDPRLHLTVSSRGNTALVMQLVCSRNASDMQQSVRAMALSVYRWTRFSGSV